MDTEKLKSLVTTQLEDLKARDLKLLDVSSLTSITDYMCICSGTSNRHLKSMATGLVQAAKEAGVMPVGVEGEDSAEWVLVDLGDIIVHLMLPATRDFYQLEKLWDINWAEAGSRSSQARADRSR